MPVPRAFLSAGLAAALVVPVAAVAAEIPCRAGGQRYAPGTTACISICGVARLARCDRVDNVASWTFVLDSCPEVRMTPLPSEFRARTASVPAPAAR